MKMNRLSPSNMPPIGQLPAHDELAANHQSSNVASTEYVERAEKEAARFSRVAAAIAYASSAAEIIKDKSRRVIGVAALVGSLAFTATASADTDTYKVRSGDNLTQIAESHDMSLNQLLKKNPKQRVTPNVIEKGIVLSVRNTAGSKNSDKTQTPKRYIVKNGDSLIGIAETNKTTLAKVLKLNPQFRDKPNQIKPGQKVTLQKPSSTKHATRPKAESKQKQTSATKKITEAPTTGANRVNKFTFKELISDLQTPATQPQTETKTVKQPELVATPVADTEIIPAEAVAAPEKKLSLNEIQEIARQRHSQGLSTVITRDADGEFKIEDYIDNQLPVVADTSPILPTAEEPLVNAMSTFVEIKKKAEAEAKRIQAEEKKQAEKEAKEARIKARENFADNIVEAAKKEYAKNGGKFLETGGENTGPQVQKYTNGESGPGAPWCAWFVSYVYDQAGLSFEGSNLARPDGTISHTDNLSAWFDQNGIHFTAQSEEFSPKAGDVIMYGGNHTGVVVKVDGDIITTIEGNTSDDNSQNYNGDTVGMKHFNYKTHPSTSIMKFGRVKQAPTK